MNRFYDEVAKLAPERTYFLLTGLCGSFCGEKGIVCDQGLLYESRPGCFADVVLSEQERARGLGRICLEAGEFYYERLGSTGKLLICGGGHVGVAVVQIGKMLGFHITVVEDRPFYADRARLAGADQVICDDFARALRQLSVDLDTYVMILTRGHRYDEVCLKELLGRSYAYLGMIGSRSRVKKMKEDLIGQGYPEKELARMFSPIGLSVGAATPQEIAVAIAAQVIQEKNKAGRGNGFDPELAEFLFQKKYLDEPAVLATIIARKGSAPRGIGAKMIITQDGRTRGTIGGGCIEADICGRARALLAAQAERDVPAVSIVEADLTGTNEDEGMVCGGIITVSLELLRDR